MARYRLLIVSDALRQLLDDPSCRIVDCRFDLMEPAKGLQEYRCGHIPGAQYANLDEDLAGPITPSSGRHPLPSVDAFAATLGRWGISNDSQVVVYDHGNGGIAARLWWMLRWVGHEAVALLDGGYEAWRAAGYPISDREQRVAAADFHPTPDPSRIISTAELEAMIQSDTAPPIVDARDASRYAGSTEPIDSVAGHVPGALNSPFSDSVTTDGRWKGVDELKAGWDEVLRRPESWVVMCGSGVTACHLALSAKLAGLPEPRLYAGSWSEWIRNPERPIETGPGSRQQAAEL